MIKTAIDTIKAVIDEINKMMAKVYEMLTDPSKFGEFLLKAMEAVW